MWKKLVYLGVLMALLADTFDVWQKMAPSASNWLPIVMRLGIWGTAVGYLQHSRVAARRAENERQGAEERLQAALDSSAEKQRDRDREQIRMWRKIASNARHVLHGDAAFTNRPAETMKYLKRQEGFGALFPLLTGEMKGVYVEDQLDWLDAQISRFARERKIE